MIVPDSLIELHRWIVRHRPDLNARLGKMPLPEVVRVLNEETGLDVRPSDPVDLTAAQFLAALKAKANAS